MHPFYTPWKHPKTERALGTNGLISNAFTSFLLRVVYTLCNSSTYKFQFEWNSPIHQNFQTNHEPAHTWKFVQRQLPHFRFNWRCRHILFGYPSKITILHAVKPLYSANQRFLKNVSTIMRCLLYRVFNFFEEKIIINKNLTISYVKSVV